MDFLRVLPFTPQNSTDKGPEWWDLFVKVNMRLRNPHKNQLVVSSRAFLYSEVSMIYCPQMYTLLTLSGSPELGSLSFSE